tara:strand:- start:8 stop:1612 length:1605 start_codon:yes stop_codon:yes gene_type:complete
VSEKVEGDVLETVVDKDDSVGTTNDNAKERAVDIPWRILGLMFVLYTVVMGIHVYSHSATNSVDSLFHIRLARLYWERGLFTDFPWMYFSVARDYWADHHFLYHLLLIPFTLGDLFEGMRASAVVFGALALTACVAYLYAHRIRHAWVYGLVLLMSSDYFLFRISMPRAMGLSLILLLVGLWLLETRRDRWLLPLGVVFIWSYQTAVVLIPMACCAVVWFGVLERKLDIKPVLYAFAGILLGLTLNPFVPHSFDFLFFHLISGHMDTKVVIGEEWHALALYDLVYRCFPAVVMGVLVPIVGIGAWRRWPKSVGMIGCGAFVLLLASLRSIRMLEYAVPFCVLFGARIFDSLLWRRADTITPLDTPDEDGPAPLMQARLMRPAVAAFVIAFVGMGVVYHIDIHKHAFDIHPQRAQKAALWLKKHTPKDSIVFHTHWVTFSFLFFHNTHNRYISGLNPHFLYSWNPKLYKTYMKIGRGMSRQPAKLIQHHFDSKFVFLMGRRQNFRLALQLERSPYAKLAYHDKNVRIYRLFHKKR